MIDCRIEKDMQRKSVCIATFNGEKYIIQQLISILSQLAEDDEVIISDDSSTDATLTLIRKLNDPRVRIFANNKFHSPIYNFEFCLTKTTGDIIFFSDQDDIWLPEKVRDIMKVFKKDPDVTLVASNARIIDFEGEMISGSFYHPGFRFTSRVLENVIKNRFLGCSIAMRRSMLQIVIPFPSRIPMHDSWLGIMNQLFGKVHFINTPLIAFRQHEVNYHPTARTGIIRILTWRWHLIKAIFWRMLTLRFRALAKRFICDLYSTS